MRFATVMLCACAADPASPPPSQGGPYAIVTKLNLEREMILEGDFSAFARGELPSRFRITMRQLVDGELNAIFHRDYEAGTWLSSSPSPGVIVDETPRIEPQCDGCHADFAESAGMFTLPALYEAAARDATARISCDEAGTIPCAQSVYRAPSF